MDFITTLPVTNENQDAMMVIVDKLTDLVMLIPTRTNMDTVEPATKFFIHLYRWLGLPKQIISDMDGSFISIFLKEVFTLTQARLAMSTSHHPQTDRRKKRQIKLWMKLSDSTSTTNKLIGTTCYQLSNTPTTLACKLPLD
jgi:hypothetical protein